VSRYFGENRQESDHSRKSLRGGAVSIVARAVNALVQIGSVLFLARLLTPEDYGLVSMVTALTGFAPVLVDLGTRDAMVQRDRLSEGEVSSLFWMTLGLGSVMAVLIAAAGPLIGSFYHEPRLPRIVVVSSLTFITAALTCQHQALLRRAMEFQKLAVSEVVANVLSAVTAIVMALNGFGYWALVLRPILLNAFLAAGLWLQAKWLPGRPAFTSGVTEMIKFGRNLTGFTMTDFTRRSADRVAIGYRSGAVALGYYQNALFIYDNLLDVLIFPLHSVAVAGLSKVRHDLPEMRRLWGKALSTLCFFSMPAFGMLAVTSQDVIVLILGKKWAQAGVLLSILAFRGIPNGVERTHGWLHVAANRTDRWMRWGVFSMVAQLAALFAGLPFGATGVAIAYTVCMFILFIPALWYGGEPLGIRVSDIVNVTWRQMTGSLVAAAVGLGLRHTALIHLNPLPRTALLISAYVVVYLVVVVGVLRLHTPISVTLSLVKDFLPARMTQHRIFSAYGP